MRDSNADLEIFGVIFGVRDGRVRVRACVRAASVRASVRPLVHMPCNIFAYCLGGATQTIVMSSLLRYFLNVVTLSVRHVTFLRTA